MSSHSHFRRVAVIIGIALLILCAALAVVIAAALVNALLVEESEVTIDVIGLNESLIDKHLDNLVDVFRKSITFKTISNKPGDYDREELEKMLDFLEESFPLTLKKSTFISAERVNNYSLLLTIKGTDKRLQPYMLTGHLDVVPAAEDQWKAAPFSGKKEFSSEIGQEIIWGRGSIDDKVAVIGILSSLELLLKSGWQPTRSFYVGFGHDEEVGGDDGAREIAKLLQSRGVQLDFLIDEGVPITVNVMPGIHTPVAVIGVTEKGYLTLEMKAKGTGGHSSIPSNDQAVAKLSAAINAIYENPQPSMFGEGPEEDMLRNIAPKAEWPYKLVFANMWLFRPFIPGTMSKRRESNAMIRTTTAVTIVKAGVKENVIPNKAVAFLNHRVHPAQSLENVLQHDKDAINNPEIELKVLDAREPQPISPYGPESIPYTLLTSVLKYVYPNIISTPGVMVANTDTRHYLNLTSNLYRIGPYICDKECLATFHGNDEMLPVSNFRSVIKVFSSLILQSEIIEEAWGKLRTSKGFGEL